MKRLTRCTLVALVALAIFAPQSHAQSGLVPKTVLVGFHTTLDPSTFASASIAFSAGDSVSAYRGTGIRNSAQQVDTTVAINLRQFVVPGPTGTASDTVAYLRFQIYPVGTSPAVTADSITAVVQLSEDRVNWTGTTYSGPYSASGTTPTSCIILEEGTSNNFNYVVREQLGSAGLLMSGATSTAMNVLRTYGAKFMRLLLTGDHTGQYAVDVTGFIPNAGPTYSP